MVLSGCPRADAGSLSRRAALRRIAQAGSHVIDGRERTIGADAHMQTTQRVDEYPVPCHVVSPPPRQGGGIECQCGHGTLDAETLPAVKVHTH